MQQVLQLSSNLEDREKEILKRIGASTKHMNELITNLLELTNLRLGRGMNINKTPTDIAKESEKIIQEFQIAYPKADFHFEAAGPVQGEWDGLRLKQVVTNLMANALRHGRPGGPVKVTILAEGKNAVLSVHNEGSPIPEEIRDKIFNGMYTNATGSSGKQTTYGLGLYIIREIVEGHNGHIELESTEVNGTTFTVYLPRH